MNEEKVICPCGSSLTVRLGNETHCNSCGKSFRLDKNPVSTQALGRKAQRSASTGFTLHHHACEGLAEIEQQYNEAEADLRTATLNVLRCKGDDPELPRLRHVERDAKDRCDRLRQNRAELVNSRVSA